MLLADLGAEVIKIERPPKGDTARDWPYFGPSVFLALNRNKKSLALDLTTESGRDVLERLVRKADIIVENFAPGVAEKLGVGYKDVRHLNSGIIYCSISGYGKSNPYSELPAWDPVIQALSGLMSVTGEKSGRPVRIGVSVVDMGAGLFGALGILSTLLAQRNGRRKRRGTFLDISLFDSATVWMAFWTVYYSLFQKLPERSGSAWPAFCPYQAFKARDGFVFIGASNEEYWQKLCRVLGVEHLLRDDRFLTNQLRLAHSEELVSILEKTTTRLSSKNLVSSLRAERVPCSPVNDISSLINDEGLRSRQMIEKTAWNMSNFLSIANPLKPSKLGIATTRAPPRLGQDSFRVLRWLGYTKPESEKILSRN
jgi:formyl-CoA transferase/CoA:oxalate CoA-transferase